MGNRLRKPKRTCASLETSDQTPDKAAEPRLAQETSPADAPEFGGHIFLPNFETLGLNLVNFNADLNDIDGRYVIQEVTTDGLAYSAGFRNGDELFQINGTGIKGLGIKYILDLLRTFHGYQVPQIMLAVQRKSGDTGESWEYIWVIFKIIWQDGVPKIDVIQTLVNDTDEMPFIDLGPSFSWQGPPVIPADIYIDGEQQLYLGIDKGKAVFAKYRESSKFHGYQYLGSRAPGEGTAVAYSLQPLKLDRKPSQGTTLAGTEDKSVEVLDFPDFMLGDKIPADPRFWYQKQFKAGVSLKSVMAKGMYLGMGNGGQAVLSTKRTELRVNRSMSTAS